MGTSELFPTTSIPQQTTERKRMHTICGAFFLFSILLVSRVDSTRVQLTDSKNMGHLTKNDLYRLHQESTTCHVLSSHHYEDQPMQIGSAFARLACLQVCFLIFAPSMGDRTCNKKPRLVTNKKRWNPRWLGITIVSIKCVKISVLGCCHHGMTQFMNQVTCTGVTWDTRVVSRAQSTCTGTYSTRR